MYISKRNTLFIIALALLIASTYVLFASRAENPQSQEEQVASTTTETQETAGSASGSASNPASGTGTAPGASTNNNDGPELAGSTWLLQSITNEDGETVVPPRVEIFTITFGTDGRLSGTTDCNNFGGGYTFKNGVLTLGAVAQTLMFCEGSQEQEFIATLKTGSVGVSFKNANTIVLKAPEAAGSLTLVREEE